MLGTNTSKQPKRTHYLGHLTGYQLIRGQFIFIRSVPAIVSPIPGGMVTMLTIVVVTMVTNLVVTTVTEMMVTMVNAINLIMLNSPMLMMFRSKQPIRTRYLGHVAGYQPIRDQYQ
eukprot:sb/3476631/